MKIKIIMLNFQKYKKIQSSHHQILHKILEDKFETSS